MKKGVDQDELTEEKIWYGLNQYTTKDDIKNLRSYRHGRIYKK